jgi:glucokinase
LNTIPVLEIGGSHVTAALVSPADGAVLRRTRGPLFGADSAAGLLGALAAAASRLEAGGGAVWGVAIPGPFDYDAGIGEFRDVGKFESLAGVDVGSRLRELIEPRPASLRFLNDASAFGLGEWWHGTAAEQDRIVGVTLGTGVGSVFLREGRVVADGPDVPTGGRADLLTIADRPLEDTVSTRAIVAAYRRAGGGQCEGVADVIARAGAGDDVAHQVIERAYSLLGAAFRPWLERFKATVLIVGGGISAAWDMVSPSLQRGIGAVPGLRVVRSPDSETAALRGAGLHVIRCQ